MLAVLRQQQNRVQCLSEVQNRSSEGRTLCSGNDGIISPYRSSSRMHNGTRELLMLYSVSVNRQVLNPCFPEMYTRPTQKAGD